MVVDAVIPTENGVFLVRDVSADSFAAYRAAYQACRIPGTRRGHLCAAAGGILIVRGAHQLTRPQIRIEILDSAAADDPPWHWEARTTMDLATGRLMVEADPSFPLDVAIIELSDGPGRYTVALGHTGRAELQQEAVRVSKATFSASADDSSAGWHSLDGIEQYLIRLWPERRDGQTGEADRPSGR